MEIKELYHYMLNGTEEQNDQAIDVLGEIMQEVKRRFPGYYAKYDKKLEEIYHHGEGHLTKQEAMDAVSHLVNNDGSKGPHWDEDSIHKAVEMYPELSTCPFWDVFYVMNMVYSDYYRPEFALKDYVKLTKDFIHDEDAPADKVKRYIKAMKSY